MNRNNGFSLFGNGPGHSGRIDVVSPGIDVYKYRPRTQPDDRASSCAEGEWRGDDFIIAADAEGHQRQQQSVRAGGAADRELHSGKVSKLLLQPLNFRAENEMLAVHHRFHRAQNFRADGAELRLEIKERE